MENEEPIYKILENKNLSKSEILYLMIYFHYCEEVIETNSNSTSEPLYNFMSMLIFIGLKGQIKEKLSKI